MRDALVAGIFVIFSSFAAFASHASEPSVAGFAVGMDALEVERVLDGYAKKGVEIRRNLFGPRSNTSIPTSIAEAVSTIKVGADCSGPRGTEKCEVITIYFARPDLGGKLRGVESVQFPPDATGTEAVVEELRRVYGPSRISRSYDRKVGDTQYSVLGLLWGGETDRIEAQDAFSPINGREGGQRIGGKYVYAELWQAPSGTARRVRVAAGDDELNGRQAAAWSAEWGQQAAAERQRWRACVDQYLKERREQPAAPTAAGSPEEKQIYGYSGLGRVRFTFPSGFPGGRAVPHFTAGPRILGGEGCRERFEVSVYSYREPQTPAKWREEMEKKLRGTVLVQTLAGNDALLYSTQTDRKADAEYRYVTYGALAADRAVILFEHFSNDESQARRDRLMRLVASAEFLDADKWPSWAQLFRDDEAWKAVGRAYEKKDYRESYAGSKKLCEQWTASRADADSRAMAGNACMHAAVLILTDEYQDGSPDRYGASKGYLERALLAYGEAAELKEHRQLVYANLAVVHGLGLGVPESVALARSYYAKEGTLESTLKDWRDGKVGPRTNLLLKKLGF